MEKIQVDYEEMYDKSNKIEFLKKLFEQYKKDMYSFNSLAEEISFLYNLGLFFSEYFEEDINFKQEEYIQYIFRNASDYYYSIYCYLQGIKIFENNLDILGYDESFIDEIMKRCYVNLGNELSNHFGTIDALHYFNKALLLDSTFSMARGNRAFCLEKHSPFIDFNKQDKIFNYIHDEYFAIDITEIENGEELFLTRMLRYNTLKKSYLASLARGEDPHYSPSNLLTWIDYNEESYENWCVKNVLYLNFLNDYWGFEEAKFDIKTNEFCTDRKIPDASKVMLNNMLNNFVGLREDLYENFTNGKEDYYKLANIFCLLFSFFDKVSFFLYKHFQLIPPSNNERRVNMNSIWNCSDSEGYKLLDYKNTFLFNLYWMRKEYRDENDLELRNYLLPDAQELSDYRNFLEHKAYSFVRDSELYYIDPQLLESRTLRLMQLVRNMILSIIGLLDVESRLTDQETGKRDINITVLDHQLF
ncbi:hypothetical protein CYQ77_02365 [Enterococcus faecium]|uniref:LA2681-like HEPN domain-containing protein n=1 Tax=Enterococcus faecium TaxID=1352 RepID=A0AB37VZY0_ENTFC|nr:LA2681 family HEPN domain-containing protein [Enterococcus faecium]RXU72576.1 hypothetical protein CYQ86_03780 [Enterococcus faecium]RXU90956.1 hypothetical protein CYQ77_02365 [Enterococcus faecium]